MPGKHWVLRGEKMGQAEGRRRSGAQSARLVSPQEQSLCLATYGNRAWLPRRSLELGRVGGTGLERWG